MEVHEGQSSTGEDLISKLSDQLLSHIVSSLHIDEAVRTSVLSKRWKSVWRYAPKLEFNEKLMIKPLSRLLESRSENTSHQERILNSYVDNGLINGQGILIYVLLYRHHGNVDSCRFVHFSESMTILKQVQNWIDFLVHHENGIQDLYLECEVPRSEYGNMAYIYKNMKLNFPPMLFASLQTLELSNYVIEEISPFQGCQKLRTLKLRKVFITDEILNGILSNCEFLENFSIAWCGHYLPSLIIRNPILKFLELQQLSVNKIHVFADALVVLVLDTICCRAKNIVIDTASLRVFRCYYNTDRISAHSFGGDIHVLKTQEIFESCAGPVGDRGVTYGINSSEEGLLPNHISKFWEARDQQGDYITPKLRSVYMKGFKGKEQELEFVKYLITKATKLEMLKIIFGNYGRTREGVIATMNLLSLPRASVALAIVLKPGPNYV
ncbi:F-box protein [Quillaja saponaria]|uniref:F-box protein n=1 Tax=Quillaja saponaria TaxID=32244 RepID=A0AAD7PBJ8_QUISA|nr:F-box protein [Quillaja saponaria]